MAETVAGFEKLQQISYKLLEDNVLERTVLLQRCQLDHGLHDLNPVHDLGSLSTLPAELLHHILNEVDVESLFTFRRVSQHAMSTVNSMLNYQKVMKSAINCIRMAIAIQTANTFTMNQLVSKMRQKYCDGHKCGELAPYIDLFTLSRRCLSVGGGCRAPCGPVNKDIVSGFLNLPEDTQLPSRSFRVPECIYEHFWDMLSLRAMQSPKENSLRFYDYEDIKAAFYSDTNAKIFEEFESITYEDDQCWKLCSVTVPWFDKLGIDPEYGIFCEVCNDGHIETRGLFIPHSLRESQEIPEDLKQFDWTWDVPWPDHTNLPFMRVNEIEEHMRKEHPGEAAKCG